MSGRSKRGSRGVRKPPVIVSLEDQQCGRCRRRLRPRDADGDAWNAVWQKGVLVGFLYPRCQTPDENAEAEINEATTDYSVDLDGRLWGAPKR